MKHKQLIFNLEKSKRNSYAYCFQNDPSSQVILLSLEKCFTFVKERSSKISNRQNRSCLLSGSLGVSWIGIDEPLDPSMILLSESFDVGSCERERMVDVDWIERF